MYGAGAAFFCLEPEPTQVGRSRSQLRDLGQSESEPPKKVAAPQHCHTMLAYCTLIGWNIGKREKIFYFKQEVSFIALWHRPLAFSRPVLLEASDALIVLLLPLGWMNNYMRHVVASFLISYLRLSWLVGYSWFQAVFRIQICWIRIRPKFWIPIIPYPEDTWIRIQAVS